MKKTIKTAYVREPHNYCINRRVYVDENGAEHVRINGNYVALNWMESHGWDVNLSY